MICNSCGAYGDGVSCEFCGSPLGNYVIAENTLNFRVRLGGAIRRHFSDSDWVWALILIIERETGVGARSYGRGPKQFSSSIVSVFSELDRLQDLVDCCFLANDRFCM